VFRSYAATARRIDAIDVAWSSGWIEHVVFVYAFHSSIGHAAALSVSLSYPSLQHKCTRTHAGRQAGRQREVYVYEKKGHIYRQRKDRERERFG